MTSSPAPPRQVPIGDAAAFVGTTPRTIRYYHQIGLLPERERSGDGRRRYGYEDIIRLLWVRRMAEAGIALDDIRDAFHESAPSIDDDGDEVEVVLARLESRLAHQDAELQRKRATVRRMRTLGSRKGLLDDLVTSRLESAPEGSLRQEDLDALLVIERMFGPLGAFAHAGGIVTLACHPQLRAESDRISAAEETLDDSVAVDDPRVAEIAAERRSFQAAWMRIVEESGQLEEDAEVFATWEESHPGEGMDAAPDAVSSKGAPARRAADIIRSLPYDVSPARLRCMELALQPDATDASTSNDEDRA